MEQTNYLESALIVTAIPAKTFSIKRVPIHTPMQSNAPQFSNLRSGSITLGSFNSKSIASDTNNSEPTPMTESSTTKQVKNLIIENNTLTIGDGMKRAFGARLQMDTSGLKVRRRVDQEELENALRTPISGELFNESRNRSYQLELGFHNSSKSDDCCVLVDLNQFPGAKEGDLAELRTYHHSPSSRDKKLYFKVQNFDPETRRRLPNANISVLTGQLQQLLDLPSRSAVWVKLKSKDHQADLVELHVKDCYVNRGDMWCLLSKLTDSCVFLGQRITYINSIRLIAKGVYRNGKKVISGYIGNNTKVIFRSESARLIFLIQITEEMWHFEQNGEKTFHKVVNSLFPKIFKKWKDIGTHHTITIVFCASIHESGESYRNLPPGVRLKNTRDYFRIVVDQVNILYWSEIMKTLRKEFMRITSDLRNGQTDDGRSVIRGGFTPVIKSNILETINFATTLLADPFKQPDLRHTTTHIILVSPGSGLYDVDYDLLKITCKKLLSLEVTADLICLSRAPLHIVPLFRYIDYQGKLHYCAPTWLSISFWNDSARSLRDWQPRCKIYGVQMMGMTEQSVHTDIALGYLNSRLDADSVVHFMDQYDKKVFDVSNYYPTYNTVQSPEFIEENSIEEAATHSRLTNEVQSILWKPPRTSIPLVEPPNTQSVVVSLQQPGNITNFSDDELTDTSSSTSSPDAIESLALASLKNMAYSAQGLTKRIVSRLIRDIKTRKGRNSLTSNSEQQLRRSAYNILSNTKNFDPQSPNSNHFYVSKHNFRPFDSDRRSSPPLENVSIQDSITIGSPNNSFVFDKKPIATDESSKKDMKLERYIKEKSLTDTLIHIENPSNPVSSEVANMLIPERWKDVYPRYVAKKYSKWRSFTTPAELPITMTQFPSISDFESNFIFRNHSVSLNIDREVFGQSTFDLLRDMIYTRLLAGFQICTSEVIKNVESMKNNDRNVPEIAKSLSKDNYMNALYYMILDNEIHRISCGYNGTIDVQRFLRRTETKIIDSIAKYNPLVKTRYETSYRESPIDPLRTTRSSLRWNQLDQVLAGYDDPMLDSKKIKFRSKFVILPADIPPNTISSTINGKKETLSGEEIRLEGLRKLISSISKSRLNGNWDTDSVVSRKEELLPEVHFYTGSLFEFLEEQSDTLRHLGNSTKRSILEEGKLCKDIELSKLAQELQFGDRPLKLINRKWHFKNHKNCFIGLEFVNWLIENFSDIDTRDEAVAYGQQLMGDGLFHHVESRHGFLDGHYFYQIYPQYAGVSLEKKSSNEVSTSTDSQQATRRMSISTTSSKHASNTPIPLVTKAPEASLLGKSVEDNNSTRTLLISTAIDINLDLSGNSDKLETCTVHYDRVHNPEHCFHIRLEWLTATPKLIDDLINNWSRLCERYGLRLVEVPWNELCTLPSFNPSHSFVETSLAINPWKDPEFKDEELFAYQKYFYHVSLLEHFGFLLDNRASKILQKDELPYNVVYSWGKPTFKYAQFIHNTGACMAEIRENGDLFLAPNNAYISRINIGSVVGNLHAPPKFALNSGSVMLTFKQTCDDYTKLRHVFLSAKEKWLEHKDSIKEPEVLGKQSE
ncbi:GTPase-activating protein IML1 Ecym_5150 [Eremothecium cymbalariae DBVPG|uniref:Vacuolar membrane-associated protein IML1 n=1 Tax=Eremothecium cymbalariae (strain CBS 270.75 / DBVPG 7215 / KCTC 17166 / NRRL Y-17582) TaxID=931890 RepID=I6NCY5_ERECY|nr:hypothetical protein Ecym_5150 [Eremothecium cymbalariae DBVPG\